MSGDTGGLDWFKSSYSGSQGDSCVEVAYGSGAGVGAAVHVRDSKDRESPRVAVSLAAWVVFVGYAGR
ncbi:MULTISPECIES: DUF397 domain-containing protein [unclassified Streptomyces]|uniref:DUF397 domain-containing protein n=1 Tax=unclassified Streptomyces TaxID=2593676 RepID=UPI0036E7EB7E